MFSKVVHALKTRQSDVYPVYPGMILNERVFFLQVRLVNKFNVKFKLLSKVTGQL